MSSLSGPGKVLTGLNKRIVRCQGLAVNDPDGLDAALELARETLAGSAINDYFSYPPGSVEGNVL